MGRKIHIRKIFHFKISFYSAAEIFTIGNNPQFVFAANENFLVFPDLDAQVSDIWANGKIKT